MAVSETHEAGDGGKPGPPAAPLLRDEAAARAALRRNRALATGLLAAMGLIFAATWLAPHPGWWLSLVRASAEAGIVGGLADWFAVTALFRRPLGLPIPHTAILPRSKDRIGKALAGFVEQSFLTEEVLVPRVRAAKLGERLAAWLAQPANAAAAARPVLAHLPELLRAMDDQQLRDFLSRVVREQLRQIDLAPLAGRWLRILTRSGEADVLFNRLIELALTWLDTHHEEIDRLVEQRSHWWVPKMVNRSIARQIFNGLADVLTELREPESETRRKFDAARERLIERLLHSPEQGAELNAARDRLLDHPDLQAWLGAVWSEFAQGLAQDLGEPDSRTREIVETALVSFGRTLAADPAMQAKLDAAAERALVQVLSYRGAIAGFMADVVKSWDAQTMSERLELVIGSDLQYIRMNGTVVGAIVGCVLYLLTHMTG